MTAVFSANGAQPAPSSQARPVLEVHDLVVKYVNGPTAVRGASLAVESGTVTAIVGPNGAGKTTFLQAIAGRERRSPARLLGGSVRLRNVELTGRSIETVARAGIAMIPDRGKVYNELTVSEHFKLALQSVPRAKRAAAYEDVFSAFPRVRQWLDRKGAQLSGGERQLVSMAVALCRRPAVLLIDEMSQGLSPSAVAVVGEALTVLRSRDLAVVLVEQTTAVAERVSDTVIGFVRGNFVDAAAREVHLDGH
jgi:ABC-type branched-subunit amino acid transport system ATPase component